MRILITGATGFVGYHLCRRLVEQGNEVTAFHRAASNVERVTALGIRLICGDLGDLDSLRDAVHGQQAVIHAAADIAYGSLNPDVQERVNVAGTGNVAQACRLEGTGRMVYVSSTSAIGIPTDAGSPADENLPFNLSGTPLRYHISKQKGEVAVAEQVAKGLDAVIVNPSSIFGSHGRGYRGGAMISNIGQGKIAPYFTGGICVVHVEDVVTGTLAALRNGVQGNRYILGGENLSYREIAQRALITMGVKRMLVPVPSFVTGLLARLSTPVARITQQAPRFSPSSHYCSSRFLYYSSEKARTALDYQPRKFDAIIHDWKSAR